MRLILLVAAATSLAASGCTHHQLRRSAVGQVGTVADIYQQQVLNNLAKFARDPNALPDFGVPTSGLATITDSANAGNTYGWTNTALASVGLNFGGSRGITQNWSLKPVQDPRKLELMRCAYRNAVGFADCSECCPDCTKRFANFYTGDPCGDVPLPCQTCPEGKCGDDEACKARQADTGIVTSNCLGSCWFNVGCSNCLDKIRAENPCCLIGEHCGTVVWVCPGRGSDELSKLTIAILDYAVNDPKAAAAKKPEPTRLVTGYFDATGNPTRRDNATYHVVANLIAPESDDPFNSLDTANSLHAVLLGKPVDSEDLRRLPTVGGDSSGSSSAGNKASGPTRADAQLELNSLQGPPTFLPQQ